MKNRTLDYNLLSFNEGRLAARRIFAANILLNAYHHIADSDAEEILLELWGELESKLTYLEAVIASGIRDYDRAFDAYNWTTGEILPEDERGAR